MKSGMRREAIIIGGGVAGPVLAMALQEAGVRATIFEAHRGRAETVGSFLNTASNGLAGLRAIGAADAVVAAGFPTPRMVMWSGSGKRLGQVANGGELDDGTVSVTIKRGLLHAALRDEAARRGIAICDGKRFVDADVGADGCVLARFEDGSETRGDLLIGADGLHSRVRSVIDPQAPAPRYTGLLSVGGTVAGTSFEPTAGAYHMVFGKRGFFGYSVRANRELYWFANIQSDAAPTRESLACVSPDAWKLRLVELFAEDEGPAVAMIRATGGDVAAYPVFDMPSVPTWHRAAMVLVGDAAHATSPSAGQGASLAIEDALVLAKCVRDVPTLSQAFARYEALRRERVERVVRYSARIGNAKVAGPVARWFRDLMMPFALKHFANNESHAWLYGYDVGFDKAVSP